MILLTHKIKLNQNNDTDLRLITCRIV